MMSQTEINDAVIGVMMLRGDQVSPNTQAKSLAIRIDHLREQLEFEALEEGRVEPELLGVNLTRTDYRYTSDKQIDSARDAAKCSSFSKFTTQG